MRFRCHRWNHTQQVPQFWEVTREVMLFNMTSYVKCKIRWITVAQHRILPSKRHMFFPGVLHFINQNRIPTLSDNLEKIAFVSANHWLLFKIWRAKWNGKQILRFICAHFHCTSWCIDVFILVHHFFSIQEVLPT